MTAKWAWPGSRDQFRKLAKVAERVGVRFTIKVKVSIMEKLQFSISSLTILAPYAIIFTTVCAVPFVNMGVIRRNL